MRIEYDLMLMERAVFLFAVRDQQLESDLHDIVDPLYEMPHGREREAAFQKVYATLFPEQAYSER